MVPFADGEAGLDAAQGLVDAALVTVEPLRDLARLQPLVKQSHELHLIPGQPHRTYQTVPFCHGSQNVGAADADLGVPTAGANAATAASSTTIDARIRNPDFTGLRRSASTNKVSPLPLPLGQTTALSDRSEPALASQYPVRIYPQDKPREER